MREGQQPHKTGGKTREKSQKKREKLQLQNQEQQLGQAELQIIERDSFLNLFFFSFLFQLSYLNISYHVYEFS